MTRTQPQLCINPKPDSHLQGYRKRMSTQTGPLSWSGKYPLHLWLTVKSLLSWRPRPGSSLNCSGVTQEGITWLKTGRCMSLDPQSFHIFLISYPLFSALSPASAWQWKAASLLKRIWKSLIKGPSSTSMWFLLVPERKDQQEFGLISTLYPYS